ncbi:histidine kinase [Halarcobacter ebronensis]|uniref:Histidine kinase n=1 Tax=Halarcobacter ebronensis TaxID=1462615 RepID=A0A4Q0YGJ1_9BACT|nr:histidine kinase [Halarcobacter ebronensis]RXJ69786.1 histidine kinase [Halarcobacter ebronensis]
MDRIKLKISSKDWIYIVIIGAFFGFLLSLFFYFLNIEFKNFSTIVFTVFCSILISLFAFVLITLSNDYILPKIEEKFWYFISFVFSFLSGFLGFSFSYFIFLDSGFNIIEYISSFWITISIIVGFLTFLIGLILHQFIFMKHKNEVIKSETLESKIKALENELNPHFLFNALNSISELIYIDKQKAEKATLDLSQFLRNAINKESLVSIKTELEMVKTYLEIENIRFDNNIILSIESEQNTQERLIPKFSIQLLVENAIKHGYVADKLYIYIKIFEEKIIVSNSGKVTKNISFGTGLNNLKKRLTLLKIGELDYKVEKDIMNFIIVLKGSR